MDFPLETYELLYPGGDDMCLDAPEYDYEFFVDEEDDWEDWEDWELLDEDDDWDDIELELSEGAGDE